MKSTVAMGLCAALLALAPLACAPHASPPVAPTAPDDDPPPVPAVSWPYWRSAQVDVTPGRASFAVPLVADALAETGAAALSSSNAAGGELRAELIAGGCARRRPRVRAGGVGEFYEGVRGEAAASLVTLDALFAVTLLAVEAALADAEQRVSSRTMQTVLARLDARLGAAEPGLAPDLREGLRVAEGVVAVGQALLGAPSRGPVSARDAVESELALVRAHAGAAMSPLLGTAVDYSAFTPRGAVDEATVGPYLAAQWLAGAELSFVAKEDTDHVSLGAARARTRAALLIARLVAWGPDADVPLRDALLEMDRLDQLAFGDASGTSPVGLAAFAAANGFDLHDASLIADAARVDRLRRAASAAVGSMVLAPLRRAPEGGSWLVSPARGPAPSERDVLSWLRDTAPTFAPARRHSSVYASALDALATWLAPSVADETWPGARSRAWQRHREDGVLAAWALLRHASVPFARVAALAPSQIPVTLHAATGSATPSVVIEAHPEAIAALLALVRQVSTGLTSLRALDERAPSRDVLVEVDALLELALTAVKSEIESPSAFTIDARLAALPRRIAALEARVAPAGGPFVSVVYTDPRRGMALEEGTTGFDALYAVVPDPHTGSPVIAVGPALARAEAWAPASEIATDRAWATRLASSSPPEEGSPAAPRGDAGRADAF